MADAAPPLSGCWTQAGAVQPGGPVGGARLAHLRHDGYTDQLYALLPVWQSQFGLPYAGLAVFGPCAKVVTRLGLRAVGRSFATPG